MADTEQAPGDYINLLSSDEEGAVSEPSRNEAVKDAPQAAVNVSDLEREQQAKYFPGATNPCNMCLSCGQAGHTLANCTYEPPKATSKNANGRPCTSCGSFDHLDEACEDSWRSYRPDPAAVKQVANIELSCSACGSRKHFVSDCESRESFTHKNSTWSLANRDKYLDPESKSLSIEEEVLQKRPRSLTPQPPNRKIKGGKAARSQNVYYSETDDSDHPQSWGSKVAKPPPANMRMASNIQLPEGSDEKPVKKRRRRSHAEVARKAKAKESKNRTGGGVSSLPPKPPPRDTPRDYRTGPPAPPESSRGHDNQTGGFGRSDRGGRGRGGARGVLGGGRGRGNNFGRGRGRGRGT